MRLLAMYSIFAAGVIALTTGGEPPNGVGGDSGGGGSSGGFLCFHGDNTVTTRDGGKMMKDLMVDEEVLVMTEDGSVGFQPVLMDIHKIPDQPAHFLKIQTETSGQVTLTEKHYLYVGKSPESSKLIPSDEIKVGDPMLVVTSDGKGIGWEKVSRIETVNARGIYNPLLPSGNLIVGGVVASVYADDIPPFTPAYTHQAMWMVRQVHKMVSGDVLEGAKVRGVPMWAYILDNVRTSIN